MADRIDPQHQKHDPRTCSGCSFLRHPGQAAQGRQLTAHLAQHPFPKQGAGA